MIRIVIPGKPTPWKAPYVGRRGAFSHRTEIMEKYRHLVREQYKGEVLDCAVCCDIVIYVPIPANTSKYKRLLMLTDEIWPIKRPDRTNIAKLYEDVLNGIVIKDDSQIVKGKVEKWYCEHPRVEIYVRKLKE